MQATSNQAGCQSANATYSNSNIKQESTMTIAKFATATAANQSTVASLTSTNNISLSSKNTYRIKIIWMEQTKLVVCHDATHPLTTSFRLDGIAYYFLYTVYCGIIRQGVCSVQSSSSTLLWDIKNKKLYFLGRK